MENKRKQKHLIVVAGPTAVGKTALCVQLARHFATDVISADSRQLYHEMHIGTARPTAAEQQGVVHHFVGSHSITQEYNAGLYEQDVLALLTQLFAVHDVVILTGGSGLYVQAVCQGMDSMPAVDPGVRQQLISRQQEQGLVPLLAQLQQLDPEYYNLVDKANPQRVIRALEVCLASGQPYTSFRKSTQQERAFNCINIGLSRERAELYQRIDQRMDLMLGQNLLQEAQSLYPYRQHNALQTVGYKEIFDYLEGSHDWPETVRLLKRNSRRYAKRQLTWFRRQQDYTWFHPGQWQDILQFINYELRVTHYK